MSNLIKLEHVLRTPKDFGYTEDINLRQIAYEPVCGKLLLTSDKTGWSEDQLIEPKKKHTWYPFLYNGKVAITTGETTDFELGLGGEIGYTNGIDCLREITELYLSEMTEVAELTREMYKAMPKVLKEMCYWYWLFEQFEEDSWRGLQIVDSSGVAWGSLCYYYSGSAYYNSISYAVRPTVYPKSDVYINTDQLLYTREPLTLYSAESKSKPEEVTMEALYAEIKSLREEMAKMESKLDKRLNFIGAILRKFNKN